MEPLREARFITELDMRDLKDGRKVELLAPLAFWSQERDGMFVAPKGLVTDFASIPRGLWNIFPKFGKWNRPAVIHDAAYHGKLLNHKGQRVTLIRPLADRLFLEALNTKDVDVNGITARLMYLAVKHFGGGSYHGLDHLQKDK